jgi:hypothetical protein
MSAVLDRGGWTKRLGNCVRPVMGSHGAVCTCVGGQGRHRHSNTCCTLQQLCAHSNLVLEIFVQAPADTHPVHRTAGCYPQHGGRWSAAHGMEATRRRSRYPRLLSQAPMPPAPAPSWQVVLPPPASLAARHHPGCIQAQAAWASAPWCAAALLVALQAGHHWQPRIYHAASVSECDPLAPLDSAVLWVDVPGTRTMAPDSTRCATTCPPWSLRTAATRCMRTVVPCCGPMFPLLAESREMPPLCRT